MLTPVESFWLAWQAAHGARPAARRAQAILRLEAGQPAEAVAVELAVKPDFVQELARDFSARRLAVWPRPTLTLTALLEAAQVDLAHARQVAAHAGALFDLTQAAHALPPEWRPRLETAALLHNLGLGVDAPRHHTAGRDLLMAMRLADVRPAEQKLLACAIRFHRKTVRSRKEPLWAELPARWRRPALIIAALLRIADGLDYSQSQTTRVEAVILTPDRAHLTVSGRHAAEDGARAVEKADLWATLFDQRWRCHAPPPDLAAAAQAELGPAAPLAALAARALADQLQRWLAAEPEARAGQPLAIKNVRAAARRARAALDLFRPYLKKKPLRRLSRGLKEAEEALADVRDWDVLIEQAEAEAGPEAWSFLEAWRAARRAALAEAGAWLNGPTAADLQAALADLVAEPPARRKRPGQAGVEAGPLLRERIAVLNHYAAQLDLQDLETYHALRRQAVKRCRFALEFLTPVLGERTQGFLKDLIRVQDRLGYLNDACVALARLDAWLADHPDDAAARRYAAVCADRVQKHRRKFQRDWAPIQPALLAARLEAMLADLEPAAPGPALDNPAPQS